MPYTKTTTASPQKKETISTERNDWFDLIKFIASFFVICIHIPFIGGDIAVSLNAIARFAVPTFFAISGFFSLGADAEVIKRRILRILKLYLFSAGVYFIYSLICSIASNGFSGFWDYITSSFFDISVISKFLFLNVTFSSEHLWYLPALIYVYLIFLLILKLRLSDKILLFFGVFSLTVNLVFGEILSIFGITVDYIYIRNFAFLGFPFFIFGYLIRKNRHKFENIRSTFLFTAIIIGSIEAAISRLLIGHNETFIGSVICCFSIIILTDRMKDKSLSKKCKAILGASTDIYIFHPLINSFLGWLASLLPSSAKAAFCAIMPIWVFIACVVFSLLKAKALTKLKKINHIFSIMN